MRKLIIVTSFAAALLAASGVALADRDSGHRGEHFRHAPAWNGGPRHHRYRHVRHGHNRHFDRHFVYRGHGHHHHGHRNGLRIAAGAVVLGSLIHAINHDRRERVVYRSRRPIERFGGDYRRDSDGQCYEVAFDDRGREIWTWVDSSYCY